MRDVNDGERAAKDVKEQVVEENDSRRLGRTNQVHAG